jgi:hypothetical protein
MRQRDFFGRTRRLERELVQVQVGELRRDEVRVAADVPEPVRPRDREARRVVEARVEERALPVHLEVPDERVPSA